MSLSALKLPVWRTRCAFSFLCQNASSELGFFGGRRDVISIFKLFFTEAT